MILSGFPTFLLVPFFLMAASLSAESVAPGIQDPYKKVENAVKRRITNAKISNDEKEKQLAFLDEVGKGFLTRELMIYRRLGAESSQWVVYWYPRQGHKAKKFPNGYKITELEREILENFPFSVASQERFNIFQEETAKEIKRLKPQNQNIVIASCPCGMMDDLLTIPEIRDDNIQLYGIDIDKRVIMMADANVRRYDLSDHTVLSQQNAWRLTFENKFEILLSNGLNLRETDTGRNVDLYKTFFKALKPGGLIITSFLTFPPDSTQKSTWNLNNLDPKYILREKQIMHDIIRIEWQNFNTHDQMKQILEVAGFSDVKFNNGKTGVYPTVTARKSSL
jgi:ubiquinone/menaquinone biosynthesis C-methylase UbiE